MPSTTTSATNGDPLTQSGSLSVMPDEARVWVFGAREPIRRDTAASPSMAGFIRRWAAHGEAVAGGFEWRYDRFLIVAADEERTGVSGCSIDSLFHTVRELGMELGVDLLDSAPIWYRDRSGEIHVAERPRFRDLIARGEVEASTIVFDNTVRTLGQIRRGEWERALSESWHRVFLPR